MRDFKSFEMNGITWKIKYVPSNSSMLVDRTNILTVATTDPSDNTLYLSDSLQGPFLIKVLLHELGHCIMISYKLTNYIHETVFPDKWIEAEEMVCNFIANYGFEIFSTAYDILGDKAWELIPKELEKLVA